MEKEYWKKRCELAEAYIEESPCDPDIYEEQLKAYSEWIDFKKLPIPVVRKTVVVNPDCNCEKSEDGYCCNLLCKNFYPQ